MCFKQHQILAMIALVLCVNFSISANSLPFGEQLVAMEAQDQQLRQDLLSSTEPKETQDLKVKIATSDKERVEYVKSTVERESWELVRSLTPEQIDALFTILIHASSDVNFQIEALKNLKQFFPKNDSKFGQKYALLTDKIMISQGKNQVYGTQFDIANNGVKIKPVQNEENLDQLRKEQGLPPLDFYIKIIEESYGIKDHGLLQ